MCGNLGLNRRAVLAGISALTASPQVAWAKDFIDLDWSDLLPDGQVSTPPLLQSLIDHELKNPMSQQPKSFGTRTEWNGQIVRIPGYIVPIDYSGTGVSAFILVPFVGACVHVPPPPANQLVFVTTEKPYENTGLYEAVNVIGQFGTASTSTQLAKVSYSLAADQIVPYKR
ncbi:DUF3299 domain-containing protein [Amylibacter sp. SFDW26]|uniref:DUF3299 domain-containing protein n=1 Tax=Amylibacter sp. SFDW26 TaxID=2652722 RepID=UPI00126262D2|nr:DUF3299 domain-containing protein [Amylibacter sp. SFDW26]KAB7614272.1 DUF3299 domain-containing protein [Amylibacter sp. SFDW26]